MATYIALLQKAPDSDFGVCFPDFPGCVTAGKTLDKAAALAAEALGIMNGVRDERPITSLFVVEDGRPVGIVHIHDCLRAGVD